MKLKIFRIIELLILLVFIATFQNCSRAKVLKTQEATDSEPSAEVYDEGYDIIVVAGQSNAVGVGRGFYVDYNQSEEVDSKIKQLGRYILDCDGSFEKDRQIIPAVITLAHWQNCYKNQMVGFGLPFARLWVKNKLSSHRQVLILPAGWGGTSSYEWTGGIVNGENKYLWSDLKSRLHHILGDSAKKNKIVAFLWSQGEADVLCLANSSYPFCQYSSTSGEPIEVQWKNRLVSLFNDFRVEFDPKAEVPILALGFVPTLKKWKMIGEPDLAFDVGAIKLQNQLLSLENGHSMGKFKYVDSIGLTSNGDIGHYLPVGPNLPDELSYDEAHVHYNSQSMIEIASRFYLSIIEMTSEK